MGHIDRLQPVSPSPIVAQPTGGVQSRKDGRRQQKEEGDRLELHELEVEPDEASETPQPPETDTFGLDICA